MQRPAHPRREYHYGNQQQTHTLPCIDTATGVTYKCLWKSMECLKGANQDLCFSTPKTIVQLEELQKYLLKSPPKMEHCCPAHKKII